MEVIKYSWSKSRAMGSKAVQHGVAKSTCVNDKVQAKVK